MPIFERHTQSGCLLISFEPTDLVMAGWTGRDRASVQRHVDELAALGVSPPSTIPLFYRIDPALLAGPVERIRVVGDRSAGEVEVVLLAMTDGLWVGLGSDHTDRALETHSVQLAKQLCRKPMADVLWSYDEVIGHWDQLILRAHIVENGERVLYQEGGLDRIRRPEELIRAYARQQGLPADAPLPVGTAMFCGALPAIGGIRPSTRFEMELEDPVRQARIAKDYQLEIITPVR